MCGIVGIVGHSNVNLALYDALTVLQHRGQDAAGIVTSDKNRLYLRKDNGLVRDVFHTRHMRWDGVHENRRRIGGFATRHINANAV